MTADEHGGRKVIHKTSRSRQREAECAAEHFLRVHLGCVNTVRAMKSRFQRQDLWACDCIGRVKGCGRVIGIQVTCGDHRNVGHRRRKLERVEWSENDRVLLGEFRTERGKRFRYWFRMHEYRNGEWSVWPHEVHVPREWFRAWKDITPTGEGA